MPPAADVGGFQALYGIADSCDQSSVSDTLRNSFYLDEV